MEISNPYVIAKYYYLIYLLLVMIMTISKYRIICNYQRYEVICRKYSYREIFFFSLFFFIFYGLRPYEGFGDTGTYVASYMRLRDFGVYNAFGVDSPSKDILFFVYEKFCTKIVDAHLWLASITFYYIMLMLCGCWKIDPKHGALLMLFCVGSFVFYTYAVNGIRNGMACSLSILAIAFLSKDKRLYAILLSIIAVGCHKSVALPVLAMFFSYYIKQPKYMFIFWVCCIFLSVSIGGYIDYFLSSFNFDERLETNLLQNEADGLVLSHNFRWDFLLYSFLPVFLGWYTILKRKLYNKTYLLLLGTYIYSNSFWILSIRAIYSARIAYLSWFIYPIVLAYPILNFPVFKRNHSEKVSWILLGHFGFTFLLWLVS